MFDFSKIWEKMVRKENRKEKWKKKKSEENKSGKNKF